MATRIYGLSRSESLTQVTEGVGAAVAADSFELTVDLAVNADRSEVLRALDLFKAHILQSNWPPA